VGAGFTQIFPDFSSPLNNWMLFSKPAAPPRSRTMAKLNYWGYGPQIRSIELSGDLEESLKFET